MYGVCFNAVGSATGTAYTTCKKYFHNNPKKSTLGDPRNLE